MSDEQGTPPAGEQKSYLRALSAMKAGVEFQHEVFGMKLAGTDLIGLRVGVNSAMICFDAMRELLIAKGVATAEEIDEALISAANREVARLERECSEAMGLFGSLFVVVAQWDLTEVERMVLAMIERQGGTR
jgi:hypothetical protein